MSNFRNYKVKFWPLTLVVLVLLISAAVDPQQIFVNIFCTTLFNFFIMKFDGLEMENRDCWNIGEIVQLVSTIAEIYKGNNIVRLMEPRWSGHLKLNERVFNNFGETLKTINKRQQIWFWNHLRSQRDISGIVKITNRVCNGGHEENIRHNWTGKQNATKQRYWFPKAPEASHVIDTVFKKINDFRNDDHYIAIFNEAESVVNIYIAKRIIKFGVSRY